MNSSDRNPPQPSCATAVATLVLIALTLAPASAATFTVLNLNDSGAGSLRRAIADAATSAGPDTIQFDAALDGQTITLNSELTVNDATGEVTIDGRSACATPHGITVGGGSAVRILTVQAGSSVTLRYLTIAGGNTLGSGGSEGGGVRNEGTLTMVDCTIANCESEEDGGGLANMLNATATLERCTVSGNHSGSAYVGGGVWNFGTCTLRSSTLSGNTASFGGAVYNEPSGAVVLVVENSTIAGNDAPGGVGGGIGSTSAPQLRLENTIVADNTAALWPDLAGAVTTSAGRNLVEDPSGASGLGAGDLTGIDPQLDPLADNGGTTRTHLPGPGSPAIDAGIPTSSTPASDQRIRPREAGNGDSDGDGEVLDIGAVEVGAPRVGVQIDISNPVNSSSAFGSTVTVLPNGNFVVTDPGYDHYNFIGDSVVPDVGAVHLYDGDTLELISTLTGSTPGDRVGSGGITDLGNGNFVVSSPSWGNSLPGGAVTWVSGTAGLNGWVSAANSLIAVWDEGPTAFVVSALANGNYVVSSPGWDNGGLADVGAVTWGNGTAGVAGAISAANSLVGSSTNDGIGGRGVTALSNGNYVVGSPGWDNGGLADVGAVTWGDGTAGVTGAVSAANSLVGSSAGDGVGYWVTPLSNGNYVVDSAYWDDGATPDVGAATWGDGATGITGLVSAANSLVGSSAGDRVGEGDVVRALSNGVTALSNGNYVVHSPSWDDGGISDAGAATWGDGTTGITGVVSAANSLVGSSSGDRVGDVLRDQSDGVTALSNGNYVVHSVSWDNGGIADAGAVTWGDGTAGVTGPVSAANSLVGSSVGDEVGSSFLIGVIALANGNYVVSSASWDNGGLTDAGAATWGDGTAGVTGPVSAANSLVGSSAGDRVGNWVTALTNGNYVASSSSWGIGVGAVTWGDGTTGMTGPVSAANSLVGSSAGDAVGIFGVIPLTNGNYVVRSRNWDDGATPDVGAVTWGDGTTGITGVVSAANSLVGSSASDRVGERVTPLSNGNYVVGSFRWDDGATPDVGAATWGNGTSGVTGAVSATNSLVGSSAGDEVGESVLPLADGDYLAATYLWDNGGMTDAGAVTLGDGTQGTTGVISTGNSVLGTVTDGAYTMSFAYNLLHSRLIVTYRAEGRVSVFGNTPEIRVEHPVGVEFPDCGMARFAAPPGAESSRIFTVKNIALRDLAGLSLTIEGPDADLFTVTGGPTDPVGFGGSIAFTLRFAPTSAGMHSAILYITNNDPDESPFDINLSGQGLNFTDDSDGDGLNDVAEFELANLGFDWEVSQPALVADLFGNLDGARPNLNAGGYFATSQVQELYLDTPLIQGDLNAGTATLTMWIEKSENMVDFFPFPMTAPQTTINGAGQLEFEFPLTGGAAFFKVGTSGD